MTHTRRTLLPLLIPQATQTFCPPQELSFKAKSSPSFKSHEPRPLTNCRRDLRKVHEHYRGSPSLCILLGISAAFEILWALRVSTVQTSPSVSVSSHESLAVLFRQESFSLGATTTDVKMKIILTMLTKEKRKRKCKAGIAKWVKKKTHSSASIYVL
jgi:hypothetical protein